MWAFWSQRHSASSSARFTAHPRPRPRPHPACSARCAGSSPSSLHRVQGWRACPHAQPGCPTRGAPPAEECKAAPLTLLESITVRVKHGPFTRCLVFESTSTNQLFATGKVGGFSSTFLELPHCLAVHVLVSFHVLRGPCLTRTVILLGELRRGQTSLTSCDRYLSLTEEVEMLLSVITSPPECCRIPCRSVM